MSVDEMIGKARNAVMSAVQAGMKELLETKHLYPDTGAAVRGGGAQS